MHKVRRSRQKGTTLVETMGVVAALAAILSVAMPALDGHEDKMRMLEIQKDFGIMEMRIQQYYAKNGEYPESLEAVGLAQDDPWGNPYQYARMSDEKGNGKVRKKHRNVRVNSDFDLYSAGPDGSSRSPLTSVRSRDDIVRADGGGFVGWATDYCAKAGCR